MTLAEKLLAIQTELKAPKNQYNSFGKYNYRNCEDILEAVKPLCAKHKVVLMLNDGIEEKGGRIYVKAEAILIDVENVEDRFIVTGFAREEETKKGMDGSQITGASSSYARKYALNGLFDIDDSKDSDTTNVKKCADCKKEIEAHDKYSGAQIAAMSKKKYGRELCFNCSVKQKETNEKKAKEKKDAK